ncbi:MAG: ABC transporter permease [Actinocatenispora sp.]
MVRYVIRRVLLGISVILVTCVATFALFYLSPQDPATAMCGTQHCTPQRLADIRQSLHLDEPKAEQLADWLRGLVVGRDVVSGGLVRHCAAPCLGYSFASDQPVTPMIVSRIPVTASICLGAALIFLPLGVLSGSAAARRRGSVLDRALVTGSLAVSSIPSYLLLLMAALYLTVLHQILPRGGYHPLWQDGPVAWAAGLLAAWLVLGLQNSTAYARYTRASMVDTLSADFIRTARAKGLRESGVVYRHGLRASLSAVLTLFGLDLAGLLTGAVFTERIFDLPGLGTLSLDALNSSDLPVIMGTVLVGAIILVVLNLAVDILYLALDPRVSLA